MKLRFALFGAVVFGAAAVLPVAFTACGGNALSRNKAPDSGSAAFLAAAENRGVQELAGAGGELGAALDGSPQKEAPVSGGGLSLERIAETERSGSWFPGLAFAESRLREEAGDFAGAALAAYKELSWAYGRGAASGEQVEEGLQNALALLSGADPAGGGVQAGAAMSAGVAALKGCIAFAREDWAGAEESLSGILPEEDAPDSFLRWMLLVCALERQKPEAPAARSAYGAIRARYGNFPEYWYRGARAFSSAAFRDGDIAAAFAEQCINASPRGAFAEDCRKILSGHFGISPHADSVPSGIRSKAEIEDIVRASVSVNKPQVLEELFPLISLPDNPYTHYALGAMKALSSVSEYRDFFLEGALKFNGRLGERLNYIARGQS